MNLVPRSRMADLAVAWLAAVGSVLSLGTVVGQVVDGLWPSTAWSSLASSTLVLAPAALVVGLAVCWWLAYRRPGVGPLDVLGAGLVALPLVLAGCCVAMS